MMGLISHYIFDMLPYMMIASSVLLILRVRSYFARKKLGLKANLFHELGVVVFVLFLVGLASQTIIPVWGLTAGRIEFLMNPHCFLPCDGLRCTYRPGVVRKA